jgi:PTH1 family peptidyl-tRNA hydrolase
VGQSSDNTDWLVVGLGNPGVEYAFTPHNFGFLVLDELANRHGLRLERRECQALVGKWRRGELRVLLAKPETYMNLSGVAVKSLLVKHAIEPERLLVVCDELDLPLGGLRLRARGSAGTHNGLRSVAGALGSQKFARLRLGIAPGHAIGDLSGFVTAPWRKAALPQVAAVVERAADAVTAVLDRGLPAAMNEFNGSRADEAGAAENPLQHG